MSAIEPSMRYRISVNDFHKMAEAGIFGEDDRIELVEGELVRMAPIGSLHAGTVTQLSQFFTIRVAEKVIVYTQNPIVLGEHSELEPDVALLRPRADFYKNSLPVPEDVLLLIEVADTTLAYDRERKIPIYARYGIAEVWLIDLKNRQLEIYLKPSSAGYRQILRPEENEQVSPSCCPDLTIKVADLGF